MDSAVQRGEFRELSEQEVASRCTSILSTADNSTSSTPPHPGTGEEEEDKDFPPLPPLDHHPATAAYPTIKTEPIHVKIEKKSPIVKVEPMDTEEDRKVYPACSSSIPTTSSSSTSGTPTSTPSSLTPNSEHNKSNDQNSGNVHIGNLQPVFFMFQKDQEDSENIDVNNNYLANM